MKVLYPITITDTILESSDIAEPSGSDPAVWAGTTTAYSLGNRVRLANTHKIYECIVASIPSSANNKSPDIEVTLVAPKWKEVGFVNKFSMFDLYRNTPSEYTGTSLSVILNPGEAVEGIALLNVSGATTVNITVQDSGTDIYSKNYVVVNRETVNWSQYFFGEFITEGASILDLNIPSSISYKIILTFTSSVSTTMKVGSIIIGKIYDIGYTQLNGRSGIIDFSKIERNIFGNAYLVPRKSIGTLDVNVRVDPKKLEYLLNIKKLLDAVPALWIGADNTDYVYFNPLLIFGFYREFTFRLDNPIAPMAVISLEEL